MYGKITAGESRVLSTWDSLIGCPVFKRASKTTGVGAWLFPAPRFLSPRRGRPTNKRDAYIKAPVAGALSRAGREEEEAQGEVDLAERSWRTRRGSSSLAMVEEIVLPLPASSLGLR